MTCWWMEIKDDPVILGTKTYPRGHTIMKVELSFEGSMSLHGLNKALRNVSDFAIVLTVDGKRWAVREYDTIEFKAEPLTLRGRILNKKPKASFRLRVSLEDLPSGTIE